MNRIPIAFAFDNNLVIPACVCISSLLMNANMNTFYEIFILHSENESIDKDKLNIISEYYKEKCIIRYIKVGNVFDNSYEIRGITTAAYYRLLIPELIPEFDKIIYADVDIIFRQDMASVYNINLETEYIAATYDWGMIFSVDGQEYVKSVQGLSQGEYIQSGFLLINSKQIRKDGLVCKFIEEAKNNYKFQDQDILNIVCGKRKKNLPIQYNMTDYAFFYMMKECDKLIPYTEANDIEKAKNIGTLHFNGHKPWKKYCVNFDVWWEYYRKSPIFDENYYFDFFHSKLNELDQLSLWKRIKILMRYFIIR